MTLSDREDELLDWLEDYGVKDAWKLTEPLAAGSVDTKDVRSESSTGSSQQANNSFPTAESPVAGQ